MPSVGGREIAGAGNDGTKLQNYLRSRYYAAENLGSYDNDELLDEISDNAQIGVETAKILQPLRTQVGSMGVDIAVLDETLQTLMKQTEGANRKITQVTHFVMHLVERLEDIDEKARSLLDRWKEESRAISDMTEHAGDLSERFSNNIQVQEEKMNQLSELLNKLESETKRLSLLPSKSGTTQPEVTPVTPVSLVTPVSPLTEVTPVTPVSPVTPLTEEVVTNPNLLVENPENRVFISKCKALNFARAEKHKTNDTNYQTFEASPGSLTHPIPPAPSKSHNFLITVILVLLIPILGCLICSVTPELCHKLQEVISKGVIGITRPTGNIPS